MKVLKKMLEAARSRQGSADFVGYVSAYCDNRECVARDFEVKIKDHCDDDHPVSVRCPICGKAPILNRVRTLSEHEKSADYDARIRVNVQRYKERTGDMFVPVSIFFDDSLDGKSDAPEGEPQ